MRDVDRRAITDARIPSRVLMEHAGKMLADGARTRVRRGGHVSLVCGSGANGGDGLVAARFLDHWGYGARVFLACEPSRLAGAAAEAYDTATRCGLDVRRLDPATDGFAEALRDCDLLVDCLLGTGAHGPPRPAYARIIEQMNASGVEVLACDLPSGVDGDSGEVAGAAIRATETLTIGHLKAGLLLYPGAAHAGVVRVADIGFPLEYTGDLVPATYALEAGDAAARLPARPMDGHKGTFGRALLLAGSVGMTGAAALAAEAVLRSGAGLVTVATAVSARETVAAAIPEATTLPLPETTSGSAASAAIDAILNAVSGCRAFGLGPGLSTADQTEDLVRALVNHAEAAGPPMVLDADALNAISPLVESGVSLPVGAILTPHPGEMARLLGCSVPYVQAQRVDTAREMATAHGVTVVLKGAPTVIAAPDGEVYFNTTGNPGMGTGGSGDVLTGLVAGLLAQGLEPVDAAILGVYAHGLAGDIAARDLGRGLLAGDILRAIPQALLTLDEHTEGEAI